MMKILSLEINNIRGIKKAIIEPNGENLVVFGPNGTGKSAVIDSIDFLFRGKISRLEGEGSGSLNQKEHGIHVDYRDEVKKGLIKAKVLLEDSEVLLERNLDKPSSLIVKPTSYGKTVNSHLKTTKYGQKILSRRELLKFINVKDGDRAKLILNLLDLKDINKLREYAKNINNTADREQKNAQSNFKIVKSDVCGLVSVEIFSEDEILEKVNKLRFMLNGTIIGGLQPTKIKSNLEPYFHEATEDILTKEQIENYIKNVKNQLKNKKDLIQSEIDLKKILETIKLESKLEYYSYYKKLLETGLKIIDDTNICPLCNREYDAGDLKTFLEEKKKEIEISRENEEKIKKLSTEIKEKIDLFKSNIKNLINANVQFENERIENEKAKKFFQLIDNWSKIMLDPLKYYEDNKWPENFRKIFDQVLIEKDILNPLDNTLKEKGDELNKKQKAWDTLTKMEGQLEKYTDEQLKLQNASLFKERSQKTLDYLNKARDFVLKEIYENIEEDFAKYYIEIHSDDEKGFKSKLSHDDASLSLKVDFYDKGMFPPNALHSEGHQDSMGLCLFLALNKHLSQNCVKTIALDDVVMSIDRGHRKSVCDLINRFFIEEQFIITTHDTSWAKQLNTHGVVSKNNMIHFFNWNVDTGPVYEFDRDFWDQINEDLDINDIPSAAHKLRRNAEWFFDNICDLLSAKIKYKGNHEWELGDLAPAAISSYKKYLKEGKNNFKKMNQEEKYEKLKKIEKHSNEIINKTQVEQWIINKNVHYNRWEEFGKEDFEDVVKAFKELFGLFKCNSCKSTISLNTGKEDEGKTRKIVSCNCGEIHWIIS